MTAAVLAFTTLASCLLLLTLHLDQMLAEEKGMLEAIAARGGPPGGSGPGRPGGARAEMEDMARQQVGDPFSELSLFKIIPGSR